MKKLIFTTTIMLSFTFANAQFTKGGFIVGGNTNLSGTFSTSKTKTGSATTTNGRFIFFTIEPQAGYFVIDNLAIGTGLNY